MWPHLSHLLTRSFVRMPSIISGNWAAVFLSVAIFSIFELGSFLYHGWEDMKRRWKEDAAIGLLSVLGGWLLLFAVSLVLTIYEDHQSLVAENKTLSAATYNLVDPKAKDEQIAKLTTENYQLKAAIKTRESPEVRIFPVSHQETRSDVTRMEYVLTTGKMRTPVEITTSCDFPVADFHIGFLTTTGGYSSTTTKNKISSTSYQIVIQSPTWSPTMPIHATVEFERALDSRPTCKFLVQ
jgi:hypothetical protein